MHSVLELLNLTTDFFTQKGIESARLNAELLLAEILNCKRLELYLSFDKPVKDEEVNQYRTFVKRRGNREPLQYILGYVEFYGLTFSVNKSVLIPRQETEILIETILNQSDKNAELRILDIGTGSGNIPVSLAHHLPNAKIVAVDKSSEALSVAENNAAKNHVSEKITFLQINILNSPMPQEVTYDVIVSNPPYVSQTEFTTLQKEIVEYEPDFAVTDFNDGLTFYRKILELAKKHLNENGKIYFEVGAGQADKVKSLFDLFGFSSIKIWKDYSNIARVVQGELR